jgi:2-methylisocitrate lyase-like PEP mutase family enzyme
MPVSPSAHQVAIAERLRGLHRPGAPLLLPNAWDVVSARLVERAGFEAVATTVRGAIEAGAVGLNLEDATGDPAHPLFDIARQVERVAAGRAAAGAAGVPLVINARTDVFLARVGAPERRLGVARVSLGSALLSATLGATQRVLEMLRRDGDFGIALTGAIPYAELQALLGEQ